MTTPSAAGPEEGTAVPLYVALRTFGLVVLALMLASVGYSVWIALENWSAIGV